MVQEASLDAEFLKQKEEGKRRMYAYEGIPEPVRGEMRTMNFDGPDGSRTLCSDVLGWENAEGRKFGVAVGKHKLPGAGQITSESVALASQAADEFIVYPDDPEGLATELRDLDRDIEGFVKSEGVRFE
jgi:hypothetical protein